MISGPKRTSSWLHIACALVLMVGTLSANTASTKTSGTTSAKKTKSSSSATKHKSKKTHTSRKRGQQNIDSARAREIQEALIRDGYLQGNASGKWDQNSQKAMEKFQSDNGWQSKVIPDSRALIKLGLGPDHQHLLNPESAMTTAPLAGPAAAKDDAAATTPAPQK